ncbi:hypothetical protein Golomagni_00492 [Golovinomyces magnicellulatus]|nr:hypothetical protein Golomagni_00492 [Golovinomyces magnicellulatus]
MARNALDSRCSLGSTALFLISGSIMLMFFVILSGVRDVTPFNKTWFLQVDTSDITGSRRPLTQWTYFFICSAQNKNCGSPVPALPIGYAWPGGSLDVPPNLVGYVFRNHVLLSLTLSYILISPLVWIDPLPKTQQVDTFTTCGGLDGSRI